RYLRRAEVTLRGSREPPTGARASTKAGPTDAPGIATTSTRERPRHGHSGRHRPPRPRVDRRALEPLRVRRPAGPQGGPAVAVRGGPLGTVLVQRAALVLPGRHPRRRGGVRAAAVLSGRGQPGLGQGRPGLGPGLYRPA